jgi:nucleoside 2-deoxyribosyltransferase
MKPVVYLSGPISGLTYGDSVSWREAVAPLLEKAGISVSSPMRGKAFLDTGNILTPEGDNGTGLASPKGITMRDRYDVMSASCMLVNLLGAQRVSIGTMIELGWADANRVPIVLVMEKGNLHSHCIVESVSGYIVDDLFKATEMVKFLLAPYTK